MRGSASRVALAGTLAVCAAVLGASAAVAHVSVTPDTATKGEQATLSFRVPNERDSTDTTKLEVEFPADHPLSRASVEVKPGWSYEIIKEDAPSPSASPSPAVSPSPSVSPSASAMSGHEGMDMSGHGGMDMSSSSPTPSTSASPSATPSEPAQVVKRIVWEAKDDSAAIPPGAYDLFTVRLGPLPTDADSLHFKALQTYSDGEVVRWIEVAAEGADRPAHPAPLLTLTAAGASPTASPMEGMGAMAGMDHGSSDGSKHAGMPGMDMSGEDASGKEGSGNDMSGMDMSSMNMTADRDDSVNLALATSIVGLFVGLVAGTLGGTALRRTRRGDS